MIEHNTRRLGSASVEAAQVAHSSSAHVASTEVVLHAEGTPVGPKRGAGADRGQPLPTITARRPAGRTAALSV
jgi:hypothetical protein